MAKVWYLQVLDISTSVCLYNKQWHWNEDARVEGLRALVHSFSQFAREIDGGAVETVHFGQALSMPISISSNKSTTSSSRRYSTSLRQNLLQSRSSHSSYGTNPAAALSINTSSSPPGSLSSFHSVSPQSSPVVQSPPPIPKQPKLQLLSRENDYFQVVVFHVMTNDEIRDVAQSILDKFTAMFANSTEFDTAKPLLQAMIDRDENKHILGMFQRFDLIADEFIDVVNGVQIAQL
ncbi:hypothetical protein LEN26_018369 [Aphanomyces euteiches]|nr:hypothetical protein Ae201684P_000160 [Aphanomyces euteiches]KAH9092461.1 hypothetical protein LEN26_018369 [Aphanomyces euteiches]KAH9125579.1 hypothetical protein AeMF1_003834 [Aphanomyces euteiches]KAH9154211.1 hypothetical protein AeRB84_003652 [Aphanomyces euteiches]KAH9189497.1 hypothetical protein AeNC1_008525 [Aphanomyces euteiches]